MQVNRCDSRVINAGCSILPRQGEVAPQVTEGADTERSFRLPPPPSGKSQPPPPGGGGFWNGPSLWPRSSSSRRKPGPRAAGGRPLLLHHPPPAVTRSQFRHPSESWGIPVIERPLAARDPSFRWGDGVWERTLPSSSPRTCSGVHGSAHSRLPNPRNRGCRNKPGMTDYLKRSANRVPGHRRCASSTPRWASCTSRQGWSRRSGCSRW